MGNNLTKIIAIVAVSAVAPATITPAHAQPNDISDLVGARAAGAETQMQNRGYSNTGMRGGAQYWWNSSSSTCARVVVANGRYASVSRASASDCGRSGSNSDNTAAGVIAGAAVVGLIAALASHHSKTQDRHRQQADHDAEYSRGFQDGLYGSHYDEDDSEGYHEGYMAGEQEAANRRNSNRGNVRGASPAALDACSRRGDEYLSMPAGTSVPVSVDSLGRDRYEITVAAGHYRARCTVDRGGRVSDMNPY